MIHYKFIRKTLSNTIKETKISYHNTKITTSENEIKMTWNIVKSIKIGGQYMRNYRLSRLMGNVLRTAK